MTGKDNKDFIVVAQAVIEAMDKFVAQEEPKECRDRSGPWANAYWRLRHAISGLKTHIEAARWQQFYNEYETLKASYVADNKPNVQLYVTKLGDLYTKYGLTKPAYGACQDDVKAWGSVDGDSKAAIAVVK
jgi:hypothetical protein